MDFAIECLLAMTPYVPIAGSEKSGGGRALQPRSRYPGGPYINVIRPFSCNPAATNLSRWKMFPQILTVALWDRPCPCHRLQRALVAKKLNMSLEGLFHPRESQQVGGSKLSLLWTIPCRACPRSRSELQRDASSAPNSTEL
jgi:hypothetical protein